MKVAIVDDEKHCVESLVLHLEELYPSLEIVYKSNRPEEAAGELAKIRPDLLFLDVEMPGMNGFELLEQLQQYSFDVIFTTAYSKYAVKAFRYRAMNYLLKPIDEEELKEAVERWREKKKQDVQLNSDETIEKLLEDLKTEGVLQSKIAVPVTEGFEFIEVDNILYCKSENNYTRICLADGSKVLISKTLKSAESTLERYHFVRIHQSYLINPNYMRRYNRHDGGYIVMENGESIPVSNRKKDLIPGIFKAISKKK